MPLTPRGGQPADEPPTVPTTQLHRPQPAAPARTGRRRRTVLIAAGAAVLVAAAVGVTIWATQSKSDLVDAPYAAPTDGLDLSTANRRDPVPGMYDWSKAGYRGNGVLPGPQQINPDPACQITSAELADEYDVHANDGDDDSEGIQAAIDAIRGNCSGSAGYDKLSLITLPPGTLDVTRQLGVDADYTIIRGAGSGDGGTRIEFRPGEDTAYDSLTPDGGDWDEDGMESGDGNGGWIWPGRGLFRVQSRAVAKDYQDDYDDAPDNRKDLFEGTVNVHWKAGAKLADKPGDTGFAARTGDTVVHLADKSKMVTFPVGGLVNIRAANSMRFYEQQGAVPTDHKLQNIHMRQQIFTIAAVDAAAHTITLDKPLEYDVPVNSTSDGSEPIDGKVYDSKASPIVDPVLGVGIENLAFTQKTDGLDPAEAVHNYGNMAPAQEMHGIVFKWAADSWVRGVRAEMTGSHPLVTEEAYHLQIVGNTFDGSWNKGKGGNGYFRGSRVWDSVYAQNTTRNLRHFTMQWSASGNVVIGNDFDSDINLHGGWERNNLFENNKVTVPYDHRSGSCRANCGEEGGGGPDESTWQPIYWAAGQKAVKWAGSSGPRNVFYGNEMSKQAGSASGPYEEYYADRQRIYQFGWDGQGWHHLDSGGTPIADWAGHEKDDYTGGHGVDASTTDPGPSLFLKSLDAKGPGSAPEATTGPSTAPTATAVPTTAPTTAPPPGDAANCLKAAVVQKKTWNGGYSADVTVTNGCAADVPTWTVVLAFPDGTTVEKAWNATVAGSGGQVTFTGSGPLRAGKDATFGFNAKGTGMPTGCTVNGGGCTG